MTARVCDELRVKEASQMTDRMAGMHNDNDSATGATMGDAA